MNKEFDEFELADNLNDERRCENDWVSWIKRVGMDF